MTKAQRTYIANRIKDIFEYCEPQRQEELDDIFDEIVSEAEGCRDNMEFVEL